MEMRTHLLSYLSEIKLDITEAKRNCDSAIASQNDTMRYFWEARIITLEAVANRLALYIEFANQDEEQDAIGRTE